MARRLRARGVPVEDTTPAPAPLAGKPAVRRKQATPPEPKAASDLRERVHREIYRQPPPFVPPSTDLTDDELEALTKPDTE